MDTPTPTAPERDFWQNIGLWAVLVGGVAVVTVLFQIMGPAFEPKPSAGTQIGEIAGDMKRAAWRTLLGLPKPEPEPVPVPSTLSLYLPMVGPALGILAIVLSVISVVRREHPRLCAYGTALGATAVLFHFFWWIAVLFAGVALLIAIIENLGSFFSFDIFGG